MPFDLMGEDILVADIVSKAGQHGAVAESRRPHTAGFGKIDGHMRRNTHAAAVSDEHDLVAAVVSAMAELANLREGGINSSRSHRRKRCIRLHASP